MSRSYKKYPCVKDRNPWAKRQANKKVRRCKGDLPDGKFYRKIYDPWSICDYSWSYTWKEYFESQVRSYFQWRWQFEDSERNKNNWKYKNPHNYKSEHFREWLRSYKMK